jgi:hypothetical protein
VRELGEDEPRPLLAQVEEGHSTILPMPMAVPPAPASTYSAAESGYIPVLEPGARPMSARI